jgi:hypothetical protein
MLQGIALAGFNVVDIQALYAALRIPVLVVARRRPDLAAIKRALLEAVPGGRRKWRLIERAGAMEAAGAVWMQRAGIAAAAAERTIARFAVNGRIPEPPHRPSDRRRPRRRPLAAAGLKTVRRAITPTRYAYPHSAGGAGADPDTELIRCFNP